MDYAGLVKWGLQARQDPCLQLSRFPVAEAQQQPMSPRGHIHLYLPSASAVGTTAMPGFYVGAHQPSLDLHACNLWLCWDKVSQWSQWWTWTHYVGQTWLEPMVSPFSQPLNARMTAVTPVPGFLETFSCHIQGVHLSVTYVCIYFLYTCMWANMCVCVYVCLQM